MKHVTEEWRSSMEQEHGAERSMEQKHGAERSMYLKDGAEVWSRCTKQEEARKMQMHGASRNMEQAGAWSKQNHGAESWSRIMEQKQ
jgi:hypothetical protein